MSNQIAAINESDVRRITSGQVIVDLTSAVKEILDNSIDAGADQFECVFKNYGMESFECSDNGSGISEESHAGLALKHHTSKISTFEDVSQVTTLGFRGEALSSIAAVANLVVTTTSRAPKAAKLEFNFKGELVKSTVTSRNKGTTVHVSQLFNTLPVRKKEFTRNHKRQFNKCISLLQQYTIIQDRMKISVWHITSNGRRTLVLSSTKDQGIPKRIVGVFGSTAMQGLTEIKLDLAVSSSKTWASQAFAEEEVEGSPCYNILVTGYISKNSLGSGRNTKDRQYVYINRRPVVCPSLLKCCNEVYRTHNNVQFPVCFLNFEVNPSFLDVNVTPDKRTVLLHSENLVIDALRDGLTEFYSQQEMVMPVSAAFRTRGTAQEPDLKKPKISAASQELNFEFSHDEEEMQSTIDVTENTGPKQTITATLDRENDVDTDVPSIFVRDPEDSEEVQTGKETSSTAPSQSDHQLSPISNEERVRTSENQVQNQKPIEVFENPSSRKDPSLHVQGLAPSGELLTEGDRVEESAKKTRANRLIFQTQDADSNLNEESCTCSSANEGSLSDDELGASHPNPPFRLARRESNISMDEMGQINCTPAPIPLPRASLANSAQNSGPGIFATSLAVDPNDLISSFVHETNLIQKQKVRKHKNYIQKNEQLDDFDQGEKYLTLSVSKADFKTMEIVGQFNLGFILVTRCIGEKFDLFIVDQHASDEKYNFEMLQRTTVLKSQPLIAPQTVELSVMDELIAMENLSVLEKNGFKLEVKEDQPQGTRVKLVSLPVSKKTVFDMNDLHELLHFVKESDGLNKDAVRCSKVRSMFAMRACRSSIMVGKPLSKKSMVHVVRNLSELDKPWNCPHGRPTMRHLLELRDWNAFDEDYAL
ncbi:LADA_0E09274g1_1 [Lachancea dasiensis]|uniref:LADA_0E09274g1_1 n=1 Tax=Lachancea dasiensis TaxID=1072105 RepID=A0A1G4JE80_9SACH|nr:LADA_0E09274g1_1 [Lachancea dasiensis]